MITVRILERACELPQSAWDNLVGPEVFASRGWLKTVEETSIQKLIPRYILAEEKGKLLGGAVGYVFARDGFKNIDEILQGRLLPIFRKAGISFTPSLVMGPLRTSGAHFFMQKDLSPPTEKTVFRSLFETVENEARRMELSVIYSNIMEHETALIEELTKGKYCVTYSYPQTFISNQWNSFEEYLQWIGDTKMRNNIRRQIKKNAKEGVTYRRLDEPDGCKVKILELLNRNWQKHAEGEYFPFREDFLSKVKENMGEKAVITLAEKRGQIVGACLQFRKDNVAHFPFTGVDHDSTGNDFTYFNILYYRPIREAIEEKIEELHFGVTSYETKARRGCKVFMPLFFYKPHLSAARFPVKAWFRLHAYWFRKKLIKEMEPIQHLACLAPLPRLGCAGQVSHQSQREDVSGRSLPV